MHEPHSGVYDFKGQADLEHFLTIAEQEKMMILLRPGPFISAERDLVSIDNLLYYNTLTRYCITVDPRLTVSLRALTDNQKDVD